MNPYDNCFTAEGWKLIRMMSELGKLVNDHGYVNISVSHERCFVMDDIFEEISNAETLEEAIHKAYIKEISSGNGEG